MSRSRLLVEVDCATTSRDVPDRQSLIEWVQAAIGTEDRGEVVVRIVDELESAGLNERYRGRDGATNVLAFEADPQAAALDPIPPIGDVVVCAPVVAREAREQGKPTRAHWAHIVVHGSLHLVGYDHESEDDACEMESKEREVLAHLGYADPYETQ